MKELSLFILFLWGCHFLTSEVEAKGKGGSVSVKGYYRKDGTYVRPHTRSAPRNNSSRGSTTGPVTTYHQSVRPPYYNVPRINTPFPPAFPGSSASNSSSRKSSTIRPSLGSTKSLSQTEPVESKYIGGGYTPDPLLEFQKAQAEKGFPQSQHVMGLRYLTGNGVEQDLEKAKEWFSKAATKGETKSKHQLKAIEKKMATNRLHESSK